MSDSQSSLISLHGGHSGQFCNHAKNSLEEIINAYIQKGFLKVGISEHVPPLDEKFLFPEEKESGCNPYYMQSRFGQYMRELDRLSIIYEKQIKIYKGMETEIWPGYQEQTEQLISSYQPDYIVGSVHHIQDISFDYSPKTYLAAVARCGGFSAMYALYFDLQYEMIQRLKPFVVGHFDLIRIYDHSYTQRLKESSIQKKIDRNIDLIASLGLAMDFNLRPLARGEKEPYPARFILEKIREAKIKMVPGDDSHGADQAGCHVSCAIEILESMGFETDWPLPNKSVANES